MENTDAPGVRGQPGERRASGRGRDSPDAHFFFADAPCLHHIPKEPEKTGIRKFIPYINTQIWGIIKFLRFWASQKQLFNL